jgi:hypothetical protein
MSIRFSRGQNIIEQVVDFPLHTQLFTLKYFGYIPLEQYQEYTSFDRTIW